MTDTPDPHGPYIAAVAAALGPDCAAVESAYPPGGDPPYALVTLAPGRAATAGYDGLRLAWGPDRGWDWFPELAGDDYEWMGLDLLHPLVQPVVAAPALVAAAVRLLLLARTERLPLPGPEAPGASTAIPALGAAVARGHLDPVTAAALAAYWPSERGWSRP
ncbi:hypothetical protein GXW83_19095 [Streptacidiphilus sp. PB12-B1b]|uniref:DUF6292 family protein n=1 Tax=Streptacidiphilus sp. PB12-B1b TaxID=2705012 RepID=UPI0015FA28EE|nr:DUF6292 family protein [Streptacidiphilus sp. PB12-B1b]QMU77488.1 hypothetical protein GXW83_19095 [Streptacidiphilus sp. PB12-B1b]